MLCTVLPKKDETVKTIWNFWSLTILVLLWFIQWSGKKKQVYGCREYKEYKETNSKHSVQSSLKSHPLWITLYTYIKILYPLCTICCCTMLVVSLKSWNLHDDGTEIIQSVWRLLLPFSCKFLNSFVLMKNAVDTVQ